MLCFVTFELLLWHASNASLFYNFFYLLLILWIGVCNADVVIDTTDFKI